MNVLGYGSNIASVNRGRVGGTRRPRLDSASRRAAERVQVLTTKQPACQSGTRGSVGIGAADEGAQIDRFDGG